MSGRNLLSVALLVFGMALGAVVVLGLRPSSVPASSEGPGTDAALLERIAGLEKRVELRILPASSETAVPKDRLAGLEARVEALEKGLDDRIRVAAAAAAEDSGEDFAAMTEEQLSIRASILYRTRDYAKAARCYETMLGRELDEEKKKTTMFQLGYCYRYIGEHGKEEAMFKDILALRGPDSEDGRWATYQIGWSRYYQEDYRGALEIMDDLSRKAEIGDRRVALWARYQAASFAVKVMEKGRARTILTTMIEDLKGSEDDETKRMVGAAEKLLESLNG